MALLAGIMQAQVLPPVSAATDYAHLHKGVNPPTLEETVNPEYTPQARSAHIQGSVVLWVVIDKSGRVTYATLLSPLPCGLDRTAMDAVAKWHFKPATMDGEVIPVLTTMDVVFRLPYGSINAVLQEARAKVFAIAERAAKEEVPEGTDVAEVTRLEEQGLVAAVGLLGRWRVLGAGVPKDVAAGLAAVRFAAEHNDARSLFFYGHSELVGKLVAKNEAQGWEYIRRAAYFGDADAQRALAERDESRGDLNGAQWYYRMCAATAHADCEYRLGKLLVSGPGVNPNDFSQGVAWLELAKDHGDGPAAKLYGTAAGDLSSLQIQWVEELKPHLELRGFEGF